MLSKQLTKNFPMAEHFSTSMHTSAFVMSECVEEFKLTPKIMTLNEWAQS
jgi:hypothetical protein